tara:strand:+ start:800 stop:922 length:123 start_codon:yes stop_codon:yes gene_type:complete
MILKQRLKKSAEIINMHPADWKKYNTIGYLRGCLKEGSPA